MGGGGGQSLVCGVILIEGRHKNPFSHSSAHVYHRRTDERTRLYTVGLFFSFAFRKLSNCSSTGDLYSAGTGSIPHTASFAHTLLELSALSKSGK
jgi:hypothetical protein